MDLTLTAEAGRTPGSRASGRLRAQGRVPGVVYGLGRDAVAVTVPWPELRRVLTTEAGFNALITLDVDGEQDLTIVKDLQRDPVRREVLHVDFLRIDREVKVDVDVPVTLVGEAKAVESAKGIVEHVIVQVPIKALPADIPNELTIDISALEIGGVITAGDIEVPAGVTIELDPEATIVAAVASRMSMASDAEAADEGESADADDAGEAGD